MTTDPEGNDSEKHAYFAIPEEAIKFLPPEWHSELYAMRDDGLAVLKAVDGNIKNLVRLFHAFPAMASLRYIDHRLANAEFELTTATIFEHEMLTLAFVVAYARLVNGGLGSGVSRDSLPSNLREAHDEIVELRNKRFAHGAGHKSVEADLEILLENGNFEVRTSFKMGYYVSGAKEWHQLVVCLDGLLVDRLNAQLAKLRQITGREWTFPRGPAPEWASVDSP